MKDCMRCLLVFEEPHPSSIEKKEQASDWCRGKDVSPASTTVHQIDSLVRHRPAKLI